ncbi:MAG TPA: RelA/SpoT domain-containing protein [Candidatus Saccharimonadales bacterium]
MSFPANPNLSNTSINRAGSVLKTKKPSTKEFEEALVTVNEWRIAHAYPINTFKSSLHKKTRHYKSPIIAQRLKRLPTIIDKLSRYPEMELSRMQDIAGVRAIVDTIKEVRELQIIYSEPTNFDHILIREDDYILNPKQDGYRGAHLVFRYNNSRYPQAKQYNGLRVELQIRTKLQHTWATAVETMGTFRGEALKSSQGDKKWLEFFAVLSSAFAYLEGSNLVEGYEDLDPVQTYNEVARLEKALKAIEHLQGLSVAANHIHTSGTGGFYHLIILNSEQHTVEVKSYTKLQILDASEEYARTEERAAKGERIEPVLVSAGPLKELKKAYPNYFLDVKDFIDKVQIILQFSTVEVV